MSLHGYNIGLSIRSIRECVYTLGKYDSSLGNMFESLIQMLSDIATQIIQEMVNLDQDMDYWRNLNESSYWHIYFSRVNGQIYHYLHENVVDMINRLISGINPYSSFPSKLSPKAKAIGNFRRFGIDIEWLKVLKESNQEYKDNIEKIAMIRSIHRELACTLSSIHEISYRLQLVYKEIQLKIQSFSSLINSSGVHRYSGVDAEEMNMNGSMTSLRGFYTSERNQELIEFTMKTLRDCFLSLLVIFKRLNGSFDSSTDSIDTVSLFQDSVRDVENNERQETTRPFAISADQDPVSLAIVKDIYSVVRSCYSQIMTDCLMNKEYPLSLTPNEARRPTYAQRHWFRNILLFTGAAIGARAIYLRFEDGSISNAISLAKDFVVTAYREHVLEPVAALAKELFDTIQNREEIVSKRDLDLSKEALNRMLDDFSRSSKGIQLIEHLRNTISSIHERTSNAVGRPNSSIQINISPQPKFSPEEALEALMKSYEAELPNPIRGVLFGHLSTAILIQMQKLKVHTEAAMLKMDKVLASNQLTMAATAAMPAFAILGGFYYLLRWLWTPRKFSLVQANLRLRLALADVERSLLEVYSDSTLVAKDITKYPMTPLLTSGGSEGNLNGNQMGPQIDASLTLLSETNSVPHIPVESLRHEDQRGVLDEKSFNKGILHYNLYRLRQELCQFFQLPVSDSSDALMSNNSALAHSIQTTPILLSPTHTRSTLLNPLYFFSAIAETWLWTRHDSNWNVSEFQGILKDIRDLESSDDTVSGSRKIMTAIRMRSSYRCFLPKA